MKNGKLVRLFSCVLLMAYCLTTIPIDAQAAADVAVGLTEMAGELSATLAALGDSLQPPAKQVAALTETVTAAAETTKWSITADRDAYQGQGITVTEGDQIFFGKATQMTRGNGFERIDDLPILWRALGSEKVNTFTSITEYILDNVVWDYPMVMWHTDNARVTMTNEKGLPIGTRSVYPVDADMYKGDVANFNAHYTPAAYISHYLEKVFKNLSVPDQGAIAPVGIYDMHITQEYDPNPEYPVTVMNRFIFQSEGYDNIHFYLPYYQAASTFYYYDTWNENGGQQVKQTKDEYPTKLGWGENTNTTNYKRNTYKHYVPQYNPTYIWLDSYAVPRSDDTIDPVAEKEAHYRATGSAEASVITRPYFTRSWDLENNYANLLDRAEIRWGNHLLGLDRQEYTDFFFNKLQYLSDGSINKLKDYERDEAVAMIKQYDGANPFADEVTPGAVDGMVQAVRPLVRLDLTKMYNLPTLTTNKELAQTDFNYAYVSPEEIASGLLKEGLKEPVLAGDRKSTNILDRYFLSNLTVLGSGKEIYTSEKSVYHYGFGAPTMAVSTGSFVLTGERLYLFDAYDTKNRVIDYTGPDVVDPEDVLWWSACYKIVDPETSEIVSSGKTMMTDHNATFRVSIPSKYYNKEGKILTAYFWIEREVANGPNLATYPRIVNFIIDNAEAPLMPSTYEGGTAYPYALWGNENLYRFTFDFRGKGYWPDLEFYYDPDPSNGSTADRILLFQPQEYYETHHPGAVANNWEFYSNQLNFFESFEQYRYNEIPELMYYEEVVEIRGLKLPPPESDRLIVRFKPQSGAPDVEGGYYKFSIPYEDGEFTELALKRNDTPVTVTLKVPNPYNPSDVDTITINDYLGNTFVMPTATELAEKYGFGDGAIYANGYRIVRWTAVDEQGNPIGYSMPTGEVSRATGDTYRAEWQVKEPTFKLYYEPYTDDDPLIGYTEVYLEQAAVPRVGDYQVIELKTMEQVATLSQNEHFKFTSGYTFLHWVVHKRNADGKNGELVGYFAPGVFLLPVEELGDLNIDPISRPTSAAVVDIIYHANGSEPALNPVTGIVTEIAPPAERYVLSQGSVKATDITPMGKYGYRFVKWNTQPDGKGTSYLPGSTITISGSSNQTINLYPVWDGNYNLNLVYQGRIGSSIKPSTNTVGERVTLPGSLPSDAVIPAGQLLHSWSATWRPAGASGELCVQYGLGETITMPAGNVKLEPVFVDSFAITYDLNGGTLSGGGTSVVGPLVLPGSSATVAGFPMGATVPANSAFARWNTEANGSGTSYTPGSSVKLDANLTLYAVYAPTATFTFNNNPPAFESANAQSSMSPEDYATFVAERTEAATEFTVTQFTGTTLTIPLYTDTQPSGKAFAGWNTQADGGGTSYAAGTIVDVDSDTTLYAQWVDLAMSANGSGVIEVGNASDLLLMSRVVGELNDVYGGKSYKLTADIDLAGLPWTPIGANVAFSGTFDGNGRTIENFSVASGRYTGLFGMVGGGALIKNLTVSGFNLSASVAAGGIAGQMEGNATIQDCYAYGNASGNAAGGIVGDATGGTIDGCYALGSVSGGTVGGIVGAAKDTTVQNSAAMNRSITSNIGARGRVVGKVQDGVVLTGNKAWFGLPQDGIGGANKPDGANVYRAEYSAGGFWSSFSGEALPEYLDVSLTLPTTAAVREGERLTLTATSTVDTSRAVWSSGDTAVATVDAGGLVTGVAAGTTTITATVDGLSADCTVTVSGIEAVAFDNKSTYYVGAAWPESDTKYATDLQTAINAAYAWTLANPGFEARVLVQGGTYTTSTGFSLRDNVYVIGGFRGDEPNAVPKGTATTFAASGSPDYLFRNVGAAASGGLRNVTISGFSGVSAMLNNGASPLIENCKFENNTVTKAGQIGGAAMLNLNGAAPSVIDCTFTGNGIDASLGRTNYHGGAVASVDSSPTFLRCTFTANVTANRGGAVYLKGGDPTFDGCTFEGNVAVAVGDVSGFGGAVMIDSGNPTFVGSNFKTNDAVSGGADNPAFGVNKSAGGAIAAVGGSPAFVGCVISESEADMGGGMFIGDGVDAYISSCTFNANEAATNGGGLAVIQSSPYILNTHFVFNTATNNGGGWYEEGSSAQLLLCTFAKNSATNYGGASYGSGSPTYLNCTAAFNNTTREYWESSNTLLAPAGFAHREGVAPYANYINVVSVNNTAGQYKEDMYTNLDLNWNIARSLIVYRDYYSANIGIDGVRVSSFGDGDFVHSPSGDVSAKGTIYQGKGDPELYLQYATPILGAINARLGTNLTPETVTDRNGTVIYNSNTYLFHIGATHYNPKPPTPTTPAITARVDGVPYVEGSYAPSVTFTANKKGSVTTAPEFPSIRENYVATVNGMNLYTQYCAPSGSWTDSVGLEATTSGTYEFRSLVYGTSNASATASIAVNTDDPFTATVAPTTPAPRSGNIVLTFSRAANADKAVVTLNGAVVQGSFDASRTVYTIPYGNLAPSSDYSVVVRGFVSDLDEGLEPFEHKFTTVGTAPIVTAPAVAELPNGYSDIVIPVGVTGIPAAAVSVESSSDKITWTDGGVAVAAGLAADDYTITVTATNASGTDTATIKLTVGAVAVAQPPVIYPQLEDVAASVGDSVNLTARANTTDGGRLSYQWHKNATDSTTGGTAIGGATAAIYSFTMSSSDTGYYYCVITNTISGDGGTDSAELATNAAEVTMVVVDAVAPTIDTQPIDATYTQSATAAPLTVAASTTDGGTLTYQWYSNITNSNAGGTAIGGATSASYTPSASSVGTTYYYCEVTNTITDNGDGGAKTATTASATAQIIVNTFINALAPTIGTQPVSAVYLKGATAAPLTVAATVGDGGTLTYRWYSNATDSTTGGTAIDGATDPSYTPDTSSVGTVYYYCVVTNTITDNGDGGVKTAAAVSATAMLIVNDTPKASVSPTGMTFPSATVGYSARPAQRFVVSNIGTIDLTGLSAMLVEETSFGFTSLLSPSNIIVGGQAEFWVRPVDGLAVGTYQDTVIITGSGGVYLQVPLSFTVNNPATPSPPPVAPEPEPEPEPEITPAPPAKIEAPVETTTTVEQGKETAKVEQTAVETALEQLKTEKESNPEAEAVITIKVVPPETEEQVDTVEVTIPEAAVNLIGESESSGVAVETQLAHVTFDNDALAGILEEGEGDFALNIAIVAKEDLAIDDAQREQIGDRPVYDFTVHKGENRVSEFNGKVTITIPYTLQPGENPNAIVVYYIDADGNLKMMRGRYNPDTATVTVITTHFSKYAVAYNKVDFIDVPDGAWYHDAVTFAAARGITNGTGAGRFSPEAPLTRGQFITMLLRAFDIAPRDGDNFDDAGDTYYTGYLAAAKQLGISHGIGDNLFAPEREISRQEMFVLLYNTLNALGELPTGSGRALDSFVDADDLADWALEAVENLVKTGVVSGSNDALTPLANSTRAELAQLLRNVLMLGA